MLTSKLAKLTKQFSEVSRSSNQRAGVSEIFKGWYESTQNCSAHTKHERQFLIGIAKQRGES